MMSNVDSTVRPCEHNDWDDVRTRNGYKVLRCRVCQGRWKIPSQGVPRCMAFLYDNCEDGSGCSLLHVRRKKSNILERYEHFGECVLQGVARGIRRKAKRHAARRHPELALATQQQQQQWHVPEDDDSVGGGSSYIHTLSTGISHCSVVRYTHKPYDWGDVTPPDFL
eukprot:TRINITY_DN25_c1_g1_i1.p1 TRINITY_DN25_c1_g1~~TRINITY_DN25_c1_g1_i1.p1  ORF type:complete len:167 (+),score=36.81 TRINITY_DN25_c1_g1_i1:148-648(+)